MLSDPLFLRTKAGWGEPQLATPGYSTYMYLHELLTCAATCWSVEGGQQDSSITWSGTVGSVVQALPECELTLAVSLAYLSDL